MPKALILDPKARIIEHWRKSTRLATHTPLTVTFFFFFSQISLRNQKNYKQCASPLKKSNRVLNKKSNRKNIRLRRWKSAPLTTGLDGPKRVQWFRGMIDKAEDSQYPAEAWDTIAQLQEWLTSPSLSDFSFLYKDILSATLIIPSLEQWLLSTWFLRALHLDRIQSKLLPSLLLDKHTEESIPNSKWNSLIQ